MDTKGEQIIRKKIVFLSSSFVNLAKLFAENNSDYDVFLIMDRRFPFEIQESDNFYVYIYDKNKIFERNRNKYFDELGVYVDDFEPEIVVCNNYKKLLPQSFIDFMNFRNKTRKIINIHHGDLRIKDEKDNMLFAGLNSDVREFLDEAMIISTIHLIEDGGMDTGKQLAFSFETTIKELKRKGYLNKKEEILNYRIRNIVLSYHERTKVLGLLRRVLDKF